jgi:hypothetical protein
MRIPAIYNYTKLTHLEVKEFTKPAVSLQELEGKHFCEFITAMAALKFEKTIVVWLGAVDLAIADRQELDNIVYLLRSCEAVP